MGVANEELGESYLESLESALADELSFTFDFEQLDSKDLGTVHRSPVWSKCWSKSMFQDFKDTRTLFQDYVFLVIASP